MSARVEEYSSDENGRSNDDAESEDSSGNEFKRRMRKTKSKSSNISAEKSTSSRKKSTRRKVSNDGDRHGNTRIRELRKKSFDSNDPDVKEDIVSDDVQSAMSDINPPSLLTRLRHRKLERRKANRGTASSTSSAFDSDTRKTKSEPILITLDSDSDEDDISAISARPNRTARIQGEIIRKFGRLTRSNVEGIKYSDSSSSSDDNKKKKKKKKKPIKLITVSPEAKQFVSTRFAGKRKLNLKKQIKSCTRIYSPMKQNRRMKIRNLRKRFEQKKKPITFSKRAEQYLRRTSSRLSATSTEKRRIPRRCSALGNYSEDKESELKTERPRRKVSANLLRTTIKEESESEKSNKKIDNDIEEDIRQIVGASKPEPIIDSQTFKSNEDSKNVKVTTEMKSISKSVPERRSSRTYSDVKYEESNSNVESATEKKNDEAETISDKITDPQLDSKEVERKNNIESDLEKIRTHVTDTKIDAPTKIISDVETKSKEEAKSKSDEDKIKVHRGGTNKKKKIKTVIPGVIRKRGRPRLSESRPNKNQQLEDDKGIIFLQNSFCFEVAPKLSKCRECRVALNRTNRRMFNSYCRFMEYRKLSCGKNGTVCSAGFSNPRDATPEHMNLWLPQPQDPPKDLDFETSKALLELIGDQFCDLIEQEEEAKTLHIGLEQLMTWKRIVQGVREMCDVCSTTIFNVHWVCPVCGFSVCFECYKVRKQGVVVEYEEELPKDRDKFKWLLCTMRQSHDQDCLVMTQMIPGDALSTMKELLHKVRSRLGIPSYCKCNPQKVSTPDKCISTGINKQLMSSVTKSFTSERNHLFPFEKNTLKSDIGYDGLDIEISETALRWLERGSINSHVKLSNDNFSCYEDFKMLGSTLLLEDELDPFEPVEETEAVEKTCFTIDDVIASLTKNQNQNSDKPVTRHFTKRYPQPKSGRDPLPIRIYSKTESDIAYPDIPHSWFCNGKLLFLHKADHKDNLALFQEQWKRGQPILVKNVQKNLDMSLWHPDGFCRDFGEVKNDLVDCKTGAILRNLPMRKFWEGFENFSKRLVDENGEYMLLKLKDWPPGEDFSEKLPTRYEDLMRGLPLPEYTHRDGILNLAGRLPSFFVRPDLGPKMYNAYGSALYPTKGTTNLHLDVSDAVNVMVYVGIPSDGNCELHIQEALKAIDEGGCDSLMRSRVRERDARPGALWHIYNARDADKIRELLTKIAIERGEKLEAHHDPIHDQSWYLDTELRLRLYREYSVEGYAIAQCLGDAVFIPAGAPHQVRNLHSCVKVAEDFVSPENIAHCFKLTQEFRNLSDTHTNHEDKLQIKNIIYHVIRDSLSHLLTEDEFTSPK